MDIKCIFKSIWAASWRFSVADSGGLATENARFATGLIYLCVSRHELQQVVGMDNFSSSLVGIEKTSLVYYKLVHYDVFYWSFSSLEQVG